ncbi:BglG family transcription antiterminator [Metabacillus niabensis]|uniref:BglG family transcription antiterminator n=1 Tax=Metabacillus niabensis TaxID=324854 RepID=UPI001CFA7AA6|nr:BglG family transcription antiterminator [Metabacillus niabensis]
MSKFQLLSSRQESILRTLLNAPSPVSYKQISAQFKVSSRTMQREVSSLKSILRDFNLEVVSKMGSGILINGKPEDKKKLNEMIINANTYTLYSPEERQEGILFDLLITNEPIKFFTLSNKYGVTEATISNDLDKLEQTCIQNHVTVIRKAGVGIFIKGAESDKRSMLSKLLHKDITFEEWFEFFQLSEQEEGTIEGSQFNQLVCKRLHKFVETSSILKVEHAVKEVIESQTHIELTDRNYVNLVVHLILAIERIKDDVHTVLEQENLVQEIETMKEYSIAKQIVKKLEKMLGISIPGYEIGYITLHLYGANFLNHPDTVVNSQDDMEWYDLTQCFITAVEKELSLSLKEDVALFEGLLAHLVPAVNRLKLGLQIHNPMLSEIKQRYPDIFTACLKAGETISAKVGKVIPEDEVGYLAIHIGASAIRLKEQQSRIYKAIVVCASGMGTSTYLASRVEKEISNLQIESILSLTELRDRIFNLSQNQLILSTVSLPFLEPDHYILVSPFLREEEINIIRKKIGTIIIKDKEAAKGSQEQSYVSMVGSAKYGEAMVQILRNLSVFHLVADKNTLLKDLTDKVEAISVVASSDQVLFDLEKREKQGAFVLDHLAMVHTKTSGVSELFVSVFQLSSLTVWDEKKIDTILLLAAPINAPKEHIEMISEISANLIEDSFLKTLKKGVEEQIKIEIESLLSSAYFTRMKALLKEPSTR